MAVAVLKTVENRVNTEIKTATHLFNKLSDQYLTEGVDNSKIKGSSLQATLQKINLIYSTFFQKVEKKQVKVTLSLYIFAYKYFASKYSKRDHINKNYKQLFRSILKFPSNKRVLLFSQFMGIGDALDETCFTLFYEFIAFIKSKYVFTSNRFRGYELFKNTKIQYIPSKLVYEMIQHVMSKKRNLQQADLEKLKNEVLEILID